MNHYLGPYAEAQYETFQALEKRLACSALCRGSDHHYGGYKFCPNCGAAMRNMEFPVQRERPDAWAVSVDIKETLTVYNRHGAEGPHLWMSNKQDALRRSPWDCEWGDTLVVTPELIAAEVKEFTDHYHETLDRLRELYHGQVAVRWGLVSPEW